MPKRLLSSLTWKAGVAAAAFALAAGTGGTVIHFANASSSDDTPAVTSTNTHADDAGDNADDNATDGQDKADEVKADDSTDTSSADNNSTEHPDNFGATVSEDAKDGGVDGREIRDLAPGAEHRNSAATDAHDANADNTADDHAVDGEDKADDESDDHAVDGQQKADDANGDHEKSETDSDGSDD